MAGHEIFPILFGEITAQEYGSGPANLPAPQARLRRGRGYDHLMVKLLTIAGATIGGYAFWALGDALGFSFMGWFLFSGVGSLVGVWAGWKLARRFE